ncbi:MAG: hypothetical protein K940chlam5_01207 [Candidatus Anoxychlamydiales bacterium]|nr:hypothetical protein [Candidatus Anoxychlamydiales bacterium]
MSGSVPSATAAAAVKPTVAPATEDKTTGETPKVETKYTSFSKTLWPNLKEDKWYMSALKVLGCITVIPMLGAILMDAVIGAYNWITAPPKKAEESEEKESATGKTGEATGKTGEATGKTDTAQASAKTRVVKLVNNYPKSTGAAAVALGVLAIATYSFVL